VYTLRVIVFVEYEEDVPEETDRVKKLLEKLRIQAELIVVWLATGDLRSYEIIVGGKQPGQNEEDERIQKVLEHEAWWKELQAHRRGMHNATTPAVPIQDGSAVIEDSEWPESSFRQPGRTDGSPLRRMSLQKLRNTGKRCSITGPRMLSVSLNMRAQRLNPDALNGGSGSDFSSDEESVASSAASENDIEDYSDEDEEDTEVRTLIRPRRASTGDALLPRESGTPIRSVAPVRPDTKNRIRLLSPPRIKEIDKSGAATPASPAGSLVNPAVARLRGEVRPTTPSFSSKAIPETQIAADDGPGPSIRFVDSEPTPLGEASPSPPGFIAILSFNDVPSRGQHVILNELMTRYSQDTAVIFTTLPSPPPNSCQSEEDSLSYLEGLEVRWPHVGLKAAGNDKLMGE
jgi:potassium/chloride transporter 9